MLELQMAAAARVPSSRNRAWSSSRVLDVDLTCFIKAVVMSLGSVVGMKVGVATSGQAWVGTSGLA